MMNKIKILILIISLCHLSQTRSEQGYSVDGITNTVLSPSNPNHKRILEVRQHYMNQQTANLNRDQLSSKQDLKYPSIDEAIRVLSNQAQLNGAQVDEKNRVEEIVRPITNDKKPVVVDLLDNKRNMGNLLIPYAFSQQNSGQKLVQQISTDKNVDIFNGVLERQPIDLKNLEFNNYKLAPLPSDLFAPLPGEAERVHIASEGQVISKDTYMKDYLKKIQEQNNGQRTVVVEVVGDGDVDKQAILEQIKPYLSDKGFVQQSASAQPQINLKAANPTLKQEQSLEEAILKLIAKTSTDSKPLVLRESQPILTPNRPLLEQKQQIQELRQALTVASEQQKQTVPSVEREQIQLGQYYSPYQQLFEAKPQLVQQSPNTVNQKQQSLPSLSAPVPTTQVVDLTLPQYQYQTVNQNNYKPQPPQQTYAPLPPLNEPLPLPKPQNQPLPPLSQPLQPLPPLSQPYQPLSPLSQPLQSLPPLSQPFPPPPQQPQQPLITRTQQPNGARDVRQHLTFGPPRGPQQLTAEQSFRSTNNRPSIPPIPTLPPQNPTPRPVSLPRPPIGAAEKNFLNSNRGAQVAPISSRIGYTEQLLTEQQQQYPNIVNPNYVPELEQQLQREQNQLQQQQPKTSREKELRLNLLRELKEQEIKLQEHRDSEERQRKMIEDERKKQELRDIAEAERRAQIDQFKMNREPVPYHLRITPSNAPAPAPPAPVYEPPQEPLFTPLSDPNPTEVQQIREHLQYQYGNAQPPPRESNPSEQLQVSQPQPQYVNTQQVREPVPQYVRPQISRREPNPSEQTQIPQRQPQYVNTQQVREPEPIRTEYIAGPIRELAPIPNNGGFNLPENFAYSSLTEPREVTVIEPIRPGNTGQSVPVLEQVRTQSLPAPVAPIRNSHPHHFYSFNITQEPPTLSLPVPAPIPSPPAPSPPSVQREVTYATPSPQPVLNQEPVYYRTQGPIPVPQNTGERPQPETRDLIIVPASVLEEAEKNDPQYIQRLREILQSQIDRGMKEDQIFVLETLPNDSPYSVNQQPTSEQQQQLVQQVPQPVSAPQVSGATSAQSSINSPSQDWWRSDRFVDYSSSRGAETAQ